MEWVDKLLHNITKAKILVYGDIILDQYWLGDVERISPEAPVPIISVANEDERLGGAGNVANNVVSLGAQCSLLGLVGNDQSAARVFSLLSLLGINNLIQKDDAISTLRKLRIVANNQQLLRIDFEKILDEETSKKIMGVFKQQIAHCDAVILSDYGKGCLLQVSLAIEYAKSLGKKVFVDPKGRDFSIYSGANLITPNLQEFEIVAGTVKDNDDLIDKAQQMIVEYNFEKILVTLSELGMMLVSMDADPVHVTAKTKEVYDVSGAGDTVIAVMAAAMCYNDNANQILTLANLAAGIVISKLGTSTPNVKELYEQLIEGNQS